MNKLRYTLVRVYIDKISGFYKTEEIDCKTLKEAVDLGSILTHEEQVSGSYIFDNAAYKKLTLKGQ